MTFVMFPNDGQRASSPRASLTKGGVIGFNRSAVKNFDLKNYQRCILYYDADEQKIGIDFSNDKNNPTTLTLRHRSSGAEITSRNFFAYFNILPSELILCEIELGKREGSFVLDIKKGVIKKGKRKSQES